MPSTVTYDEATSDLGEGVTAVRLQDALGTSDVAVNRFELSPQTRFPWGLHAHEDQEELFLVLEGTMTFETLEGEVVVEADQAVRFAPGEFQAGRNAHDDPAVCVAIGAPPGSEDIRIPRPCDACDHPSLRLDHGAGRLDCPACETSVSTACDACGSEGRQIRLDDDGDSLVDVCRSCGDQQPIHPSD